MTKKNDANGSAKCFIKVLRKGSECQKKSPKHADSILTALVSGLNLTKGLKYLLFCCCVGWPQQNKRREFPLLQDTGRFPCVSISRFGTRWSDWHSCTHLRTRRSSHSLLSPVMEEVRAFDLRHQKHHVPAGLALSSKIMLCVRLCRSFWCGLSHDIATPWGLTHSLFAWPLLLILLFTGCRCLHTPRFVIFSKKDGVDKGDFFNTNNAVLFETIWNTYAELRQLLSLACRQQTESYTINTRVYLLLLRLAWLSNYTKEKSLSFTWVFGTVPSAVSLDAHTVYIVQYTHTDYTGCVFIFSIMSCAFCLLAALNNRFILKTCFNVF